MAPTPEEPAMLGVEPELDGEKVVISGIAGMYPDSMNIKAFEKLLYEKKNPISGTESRWNFNHPEARNHLGKIPELDRFDGQFFKVHFHLGNSMDAMSRNILEQAYQAIYDAGVCAKTLSGKKIGVYVGSCFSETEKASFYVASSRTGFGIAGCNKSMFANRISYWLNAKGPSMSVDDACCSSMAALQQAYQAMSRGECEAAVVGGCHLSLHPQSTVHCARIVTLAPDGKTKSFDQNADGSAKSEAVNVLFLQKAKDAKRVYAEILHVKTEYIGVTETDTGPQYGFVRDPTNMADFMKDFYLEAKVSPQAVEYVEAFGSAVPQADKAELEALEEVFCKGRSNPLLVGSVMSNIGYGEAASGISAITKVLLGYHKGEMAANLHCEHPRQDVAAIRDGRIQILTDHKKFGRALTAVNQISITGVNAHVLLHGHYKPKDLNRYKAAIPRLVTISARQDTAVKKILDDLRSRPVDPEEHALFHGIHGTSIAGHLGRGYTILDTDEDGDTVCLSETSSYFDDAQGPLWFVYSGMGSQWAGMGTELMRIPVFAAAIERCRKALEPKGIDIVHIITSTDKTIFDNILNSFVGIAAVQIGLTDVLTSVGIKPDKIIGHSVGELGCAYADGCFTAEEMILSAYSRGLVSIQTPFIRGSMAAVGIGYHQIIELVPQEIEVACHNGPDSSTISGPAETMKEFVSQLTAKGIFAKEVPCSNIAYHSRYIAEAGPGLLKYLSQVIKDPKPRSDRWVSSSVPKDKWDEPAAKYSSAEYHTNNLLSPVLFEETSRLIPTNAICVEIAPHALLQAILKRSLAETVKNIPLTRRGHKDNAFMVLDAIGKLFMEGFNPKIENLYPKIQFPVSTETPILSHLVEWAHNEKWTLPLYQSARRKRAAIYKHVISIHDDEYSYMQHHVIRGKNIYPFSAALVAAWDTLAMFRNVKRKELSAEFRDVKFYGQPTLHENQALRLTVAMLRATGRFEVLDENRKVASGYVQPDLFEAERAYKLPFESKEELELTEDDIYQTLHERDYFYSGDFRCIKKANKSYTESEIVWNNNWVTFIDGILQFHTLRAPHDTVSQLLQIRKICINVKEHFKQLNANSAIGKKTLTANFFETYNFSRCGSVLMENVQFTKLPTLEEEVVGLKISKFIPRFKANLGNVSSLQVFLQIVAENINKDSINVLGIMNRKEELPIAEHLKAVMNDIPGVTVNYEQMRRDKVLVMRDQFLTEVDLVLVQDLTIDDNLCQILYRVLHRDSFIVNGEEYFEERIRPSSLFRVVSSHTSNNKKLELVKWRPTQTTTASTVVSCRNPSELVLLKSKRAEIPQRHKLIILASYPPVAGLKDLVKQWRHDSEKNQVYLVMVSEADGLDQLPELDLVYNTLLNGAWGNEYFTSHHDKAIVDRGVTLRSSKIGDLDSVHWAETGEPTGPGIVVDVHYTAINNRDVKKAIGLFLMRDEKELAYGMDFSGVTSSGQRVMGIVQNGAASSRIKVRPEQLWPVPAHWSLEDAVTVPSAYAQAFYCFDMKVQFRQGYKVLVHGGAGALGQAAISVALAHGCEVFTTVSDVKKKKFLLKNFPDLQEDHIGNSRDESFGDMVHAITGVEGCNVVICNLRDEQKNVSLNCLSPCGILLDTEQIPSQESYNFGMYYLTKERNYVPIDLPYVYETNNIKDIKRIQVLVSEGIARGYVRPLSRVTYAADEAPRAFRLLTGSRHRGRVVLNMQNKVKFVEPRISCSPDLTHVVLCDEQSFGLQLSQRLIDRGARKLCLHCITPSNNLKWKAQLWEKQGVKIHVSTADLTNNKGIITLLSESNSFGAVEGIYVIATDASDKNVAQLNTLIASLDLAARKLCPSVKYFAIVNAGVSAGKQTCNARAREGLPVTQLNIPVLRKPDSVNQTDENAISWRGALKAFERAIQSTQKTLVAHSKKNLKPTLLQQIAHIADMEISEATTDNITLVELGIELDQISAIATYLKDKYNVVLVEGGIQELTVQKIRDLEEVINGSKISEVRGLETFYTYVDPDELLATTEIAFLPTMTRNTNTRADEFDVSLKYMCIIPGLEGHHFKFQHLCERLKLPALILQPGLDNLQESQRELAERYAKILMEKVCVQDNFFLLGYESGVTVALEVAGILEDYGLKGTVFCVGNTPAEFHGVVKQVLAEMPSEEELQNAVARHMYQLMTGNTDGIEKALLASTWKEKIQISVRMLLGRVAHSAQYARNLIEAAYIRLKQASSYRAQPRQLRSKLVLLHAQSVLTEIPPAVELQSYSQQPVIVHKLKVSLANALKDLRCSSIINQHLTSDVLTAFEERNHCEEYLLNADKFMMNTLEELND